MADFTCVRCNEAGVQLAAPPLPKELGNRIYDSICQTCWNQWLQQQTAVINHYGLNVMDPKARNMLTEQTETFLFGQPEA